MRVEESEFQAREKCKERITGGKVKNRMQDILWQQRVPVGEETD